MRSLAFSTLIFLSMGANCETFCDAQEPGNVVTAADDHLSESRPDLPPELTKWRRWTPRPGKGTRTRALFQRFDSEAGLVEFLVEIRSRRRGRPTGQPLPTESIKIPLTDLVEDDQRLIRNALVASERAASRSNQGNGQDGENAVGLSRKTSTLTQTDYWQAILRWKQIVTELHELNYQSRLNSKATQVYDKDLNDGLKSLQFDLKGKQGHLATIEHLTELKQLALTKVGWHPDSVTRELRIEAYNQLVNKMRSIAGQQRDTPRYGALTESQVGTQIESTKRDYGKADARWLAMIEQRADGRRQDRWYRDLEKLAAEQSRTKDKETRLRTRNRFRDQFDASKRKMHSLQNEFSDLAGHYAGLPTADADKNRNRFTVCLEDRCLKKRELGQTTIEFSAPAWRPLGYAGSYAYNSPNSGSRMVSFGYPIVAIVVAPSREQPEGRRIVMGDIALLPTQDHYERPVYSKPVDGLPGATYAYYEKGVRLWYGPINVTLEPETAIDGFPEGDEKGLLDLVRQLLDLKELMVALELDEAVATPAESSATTKPSDVSNVSRDALRQLRIWTTHDGRTAQARLKSFDRKQGLVELDIPGRKKPFRMQVSDLSQQDQELLSVAFQSER